MGGKWNCKLLEDAEKFHLRMLEQILSSVLDLSFETEEPRKICFKSAFLMALHMVKYKFPNVHESLLG